MPPMRGTLRWPQIVDDLQLSSATVLAWSWVELLMESQEESRPLTVEERRERRRQRILARGGNRISFILGENSGITSQPARPADIRGVGSEAAAVDAPGRPTVAPTDDDAVHGAPEVDSVAPKDSDALSIEKDARDLLSGVEGLLRGTQSALQQSATAAAAPLPVKPVLSPPKIRLLLAVFVVFSFLAADLLSQEVAEGARGLRVVEVCRSLLGGWAVVLRDLNVWILLASLEVCLLTFDAYFALRASQSLFGTDSDTSMIPFLPSLLRTLRISKFVYWQFRCVSIEFAVCALVLGSFYGLRQ